MPFRYENQAGGFALMVPDGDWKALLYEDSEHNFAVSFESPEGESRLMVQRFRAANLVVQTADEFEKVLAGVLMGLEDLLRPMRVLERKSEIVNGGIRTDFVLRGKQGANDVIQRRRLLAPGPVPPSPLFLITGSCPADRVLVHRRTFEAVIDSFEAIGTVGTLETK